MFFYTIRNWDINLISDDDGGSVLIIEDDAKKLMNDPKR